MNSLRVNNVRLDFRDSRAAIIQGWFPQNNPEGNSVKVYLDGQELQTETHEYSGIEIRKKYIAIDDKVDKEYFISVLLPEKEDGKNLNIYTINGNEQHLSLRIPIARMYDMRKKFDYCIDSVEQYDTGCIIKGWVISREAVHFQVNTAGGKSKAIQIKRTSRPDVISNYKEAELEANCGFEIAVEKVDSSNLILKIEGHERAIVEKLQVNMSDRKAQRNYGLLIRKGLRYLRNYGIIKTIKRAITKLRHRNLIQENYDKWRLQHMVSQVELEKQRETEFNYQPRFSIVVPLYKTSKKYLDSFVNSVRQQTYKNWELCLSDGSGADSPLKNVLVQYEKSDGRIKIIQNNKQLRISENTNQAIEVATGDFIVFADHDDLLSEDALFECALALNKNPAIDVIYSDEDKISMDGTEYFQPHFKSDFNLDLIRSMNYISHLFVVKREILDKVGLLDSRFDGAQDYDLTLRCIGATKNIYHIPKVLYHWRAHMDSTAENPESKMYAFKAGERAITAHYKRAGISAEVMQGEYLGLYRSKYDVSSNPLISIIIPNKDHIDDLEKCIASIENKSSYRNYEFIIVENNSTAKETFAYYKELEETNKKTKVVYYKDDFNYSLINNFGVKYAVGEYILLLNNDTEIINEDCLAELLGYCMRDDVGVAGARLYYEDDTIQHAGTVIGFGGIAGHTFIGKHRSENGYFSRIICAQDYSAVTAACMMVKKSVFEAVGGLSPEFKVAFNDVDFCLKVREYGKLVVYNPYAELYHYESKSRGLEDTPEKVLRFNSEIAKFGEKWDKILKEGDPYYNPNLTLDKSDFSLK